VRAFAEGFAAAAEIDQRGSVPVVVGR
jgi:hypothetical protein